MPSRQFTMLKVGYKNNWMIRRLIQSIIKGEDLLTVCKGYQCAIMDCDKHIKEWLSECLKVSIWNAR